MRKVEIARCTTASTLDLLNGLLVVLSNDEIENRLLPFAPGIVLPSIRHCQDVYPQTRISYGFVGSFNPTYPSPSGETSGRVCHTCITPSIRPNISMIENYRSDLVWGLMRHCPYVVAGIRRTGFRNGLL